MNVFERIYDFLGTPKEVQKGIESCKDMLKRCELESMIIDKYIEKFVEEFGYIPRNCDDENIIYNSCLGCGLCIGTNPIQQKPLPELEKNIRKRVIKKLINWETPISCERFLQALDGEEMHNALSFKKVSIYKDIKCIKCKLCEGEKNE